MCFKLLKRAASVILASALFLPRPSPLRKLPIFARPVVNVQTRSASSAAAERTGTAPTAPNTGLPLSELNKSTG